MMSKALLTTSFLQTQTQTQTRERTTLFVNILKTTTKTLSHLHQTHAQLIVNGLQNDISLLTKLIHRLFEFKASQQAQRLFLSIPKPDCFLFNVLIKGFSNHNSISLYTHLRKHHYLRPDKFTYAFAISSCGGLNDEKFGILLHGHCVVDGFESDLYVGSALVDFYFKFSKVGFARKVFDRMSVRDTVLWNTMVSGLLRNCCYGDCLRVFVDMLCSGVGLDSTTVAAVLPAAAELQELRVGMGVHCLGFKLGFSSHVRVLTGLVSLYSKCGEIGTAEILFEEIKSADLVACNAMIAGYTFNCDTDNAVLLFKELIVSGVRVSSSTIVGLIPVYSPFGCLQLSSCIHGFCVKSGVVAYCSVSTALVTVYSRLSEMESARQLFDESPEKSLASWNAMISGYTQNGFTDRAISLFQDMQRSKVSPNPVTITSILSACAQLGALSLGKWVHELIRKENLEPNLFVSTALVDMYAKCGKIDEARQLFDNMPEKNVVTWNSMISGYGLHGYGQEALKLFDEMLRFRVPPTGVTFLSLFYACSHAGMVNEGSDIFKSMIDDHMFKPLPEHYACMVDILGRAGQLGKALEFIECMPVKPSAGVWSTLLGACMIHKNTDIARVASERLFELEPESVGYYVLLSNIHSVKMNYSEAASVRQAVKKRNMVKKPGCTLIEVGDTPHVFTAGDRSHPQTIAIYAMLEKLTEKMKEAGYRPETVTALHDVEEEEKELIVKVHSEKLAISFGLIATEPGTEIRIIKNLRVCLDCHVATKFISKITQRTIIVRDANRFHHFKDGVCSCRDYW